MHSGQQFIVNWQDLEHQIEAAILELRPADARVLIEQEIKRIPIDWEPIQENEDRIAGAFWNKDEFLAYQASHGHMQKPIHWIPPSASKLWWYMARAYRMEDQIGLAFTCLQNAFEYEPNQPALWLEKGSLLLAQGRSFEALGAFRTAGSIRSWASPSTLAQGHHGQGVALGRLKRLTEARNAFVQALEIDPEFRPAREDLACVLFDLRELQWRADRGHYSTQLM